jgi:hypothetical protein
VIRPLLYFAQGVGKTSFSKKIPFFPCEGSFFNTQNHDERLIVMASGNRQ